MVRGRGLCVHASRCRSRARVHRFGVYVPEVDETVVKRGRKIDRCVPMFSGYVFVFMWYSDQHWQWISKTPGVIAIVGALSDEEIDNVRNIENQKRPVIIELPAAEEAGPIERSPRSKKKRRWKKGRLIRGKNAQAETVHRARSPQRDHNNPCMVGVSRSDRT